MATLFVTPKGPVLEAKPDQADGNVMLTIKPAPGTVDGPKWDVIGTLAELRQFVRDLEAECAAAPNHAFPNSGDPGDSGADSPPPPVQHGGTT